MAVGTGHPLTICSLIWEQGARLFTAAKLLAKALLTAQFLCRACWEVPSRPATARHTGGSLARAWNRLLSSSLAGPRGTEGPLGLSGEMGPFCFLLTCFLNPPRESHLLVTVLGQVSLCLMTNASSFLGPLSSVRASLLCWVSLLLPCLRES